MRNTLLDFSNRTELAYLADLARAFKRAAGEVPHFLAGATARDLLLEHAHGINPGRDTRDLDLALMLENWTAFEQVRQTLIESGHFAAVDAVLHKLRFNGLYEVDLIPFGAIEQTDRTIAWPPGDGMVMSVFGFREAYEDTLPVKLPGEQSIHIVSLRALALLKLLAWEERRWLRPGVDAYDLATILRYYLDAGNQERLYTEAEHLLDAPNFDFEEAGAWLLGHDMAQLLPIAAHLRVDELLERETDPDGAVHLIGDLPIEADRALRLLQRLKEGFKEKRHQ